MTGDELQKSLEKQQQDVVATVCDALNGHETMIADSLAAFVASLCDVDLNLMLSDTVASHITQARWLFWYSHRYMTNETYAKISERMKHFGLEVTSTGVGCAINKMAELIDKEPIWRKRWTIIKRIIKQYNDPSEKERSASVKVVVLKPKWVDVDVELKDE